MPVYLMWRNRPASDARNEERILPFIGGEEFNNDPLQRHSRFTIFFGDMSEEDARRWPELVQILERKVKPDRATKAKEVADWPWWQFWRTRAELYSAVAGLRRTLVINCGACPHMAFGFLPSAMVFGNTLAVIASAEDYIFSILQSRIHESWARFFASSMKDDLRYTPSDCFETFPFPERLDGSAGLAAAGKQYYETRAALMARNNEGLTKTYNRFHDPYEKSPGILELRELHAALDRAVLEAYGWNELGETATCEFLLDYEDVDEDDEETSPGRRARRKPWRLRWPDDFRDEVLARLLDLNQRRAAEEQISGVTIDAVTKSKPRGRRGRKAQEPKMFE